MENNTIKNKRDEKRVFKMQQTVRPPQTAVAPRTSQVQPIIITALTLFALAGLMIGFTIGAFTRPHPTQIANNNNPHNTPAIAKQTATATAVASPTPNVLALGVGCPKEDDYTYEQKADASTDYTFSITPQDESISKGGCGKGKDLYAPGLVCKIWLTKNLNSLDDGSTLSSYLKTLPTNEKQNLQTSFPSEEAGALIIDNGTASQPCNQTGPTTWHYKVSATVKSGMYYIGIIADYRGELINWSWQEIQVQGTN